MSPRSSLSLTRFAALTLLGGALVAVAPGDAQAERRSSLAGNLLIQDQDDIYLYPQLALNYRNLVSFDYYTGALLEDVLSSPALGGPETPAAGDGAIGAPNQLGSFDEAQQGLRSGSTAMGGAGLLLFGQEGFAMGLSAHRQDIYGQTPAAFLGIGDLQLYGEGQRRAWSSFGHHAPLSGGRTVDGTGDLGTAPTDAAFLEPLQMFDVLAGLGLDSSNSVGARLSVGYAGYGDETFTQSDVRTHDSASTVAAGLNVGYSLRSDFELDVNLELGLAFFSADFTTNQAAPDYHDTGVLAPSFSLSGRALLPLQEFVKLGIIGIIHGNLSGVEDESRGTNSAGNEVVNSSSSTSSNLLIEAGAGPVYELADETTIAAYGTIGVGTSGFETEDVSFSTTSLLLPGFKLAMEHWVFDWMAFRTGLHSRYSFRWQSQDYSGDLAAQPNKGYSSTHYEFLWSVGIGFRVDNFELSGTFDTPFVTDGPAILSGEQTGLFALVNASYKF